MLFVLEEVYILFRFNIILRVRATGLQKYMLMF